MDQIARSPKQMGAILQRARQQRGLSQGALADLAGMHQPTISLIESGNGAQFSSIIDLLAALDLELTVRPRSKSSAADIEGIF